MNAGGRIEPFGSGALWLVLVVLVGVLLFTSTAAQPFHLDNMDFPAVAKEVSSSGLPVYYRGEENPRHSGLYHPPLYIYLLAGWVKVFGFGEVQVRMFGFVCLLLQGWLVLEIVRTVLGNDVAASCRIPFLLLLLLNPYTMQTASIADIDSTIYGPLLCATMLATLRLTWHEGERNEADPSVGQLLVVSLLVALCFWAKLTTAISLIVVIPALLAGRYRPWKSLVVGGGVVGAGVLLFSVSYWAYGVLTGLDHTYTYRFTLYSFLTRGSSGKSGLAERFMDYFRNFRQMGPFLVTWTGLVPWVASLAVGTAYLWRAVADRSVKHGHMAILFLVALGSCGFYCAQTLSFGAAPFKYTFVYWGLISIGPILLYQMAAADRTRHRLSAAAAGMAAFVGCALVASRSLHDDHLYGRIFILSPTIWWFPPLLMLTGVVVWALNRRPQATIILLASIAGAMGVGIAVCLHQSRVSYSTTYDYGQEGFGDAVGFIRSHTEAADVIVSMKDIGFKADRRYIENYGALYGDVTSAARIKDALQLGRARLAVFTEGRGQDQLVVNPDMKAWVTEHMKLVASFGNYRIYARSGDHEPAGQGVMR